MDGRTEASESALGAIERGGLRAKTALVHDWFQGYHGAERVVEAMRTGLFAPDSEPDIFTFHAARELLPPDLARAIVRESRLARLPGVRQRGHDPRFWRYLLPYMPFYFRNLPLDAYELVLSSSHACALQARRAADALHVCYCHTPMRYAWLPRTEAERLGGLSGIGLLAARSWLRRRDVAASGRVDAFVANSTAVRDRIRQFYGRDAVVVHPPVDVDDFRPGRDKDPHHFVWAHRLVGYKRPELVAEAFRDLPQTLTMVGVGPLERRLRSRLPPNVELRGWLPRAELAALLEGAGGFVHVAEEDFGISMVEALAAGTPVIALDRGGARDIVRDSAHGILLPEVDVASLREAVRRAAETDWDPRALRARAEDFHRERFVERLRAFVRELLAERGVHA